MNLFCYGSLQSPEIQMHLLGRSIYGQRASLPYAWCKAVYQQVYPAVILDDTHSFHQLCLSDHQHQHTLKILDQTRLDRPLHSNPWVSGMVYQDLNPHDLKILDEYEGFDPDLDPCDVNQLYLRRLSWILQEDQTWTQAWIYVASKRLQTQTYGHWIWEDWNRKAQQAGGWISFMDEF